MPSAFPQILRPGSLVGPLAALLSTAAGGCYYSDTGLPPPSEGFYFPTGLVVSPGRTTLYVANSDFDLQYNGGTVQAIDLAGLRGQLGIMLEGIRCTEGNTEACKDLGTDNPTMLAAIQCAEGDATACASAPQTAPATETGLDAVCHHVTVSQGTGAPGAACATASDCASGLCPTGACLGCRNDGDCGNPPPAGASAVNTDQPCFGYSRCDTGTGACMLACNLNSILSPSMCTSLAPTFGASGTVGAFASGAVLALNPLSSGARLFVPVRGDPSITWFDLADDRAALTSTSCKAAGASCAAASDCCTNFCNIPSGQTSGSCGFQLYCGQTAGSPRCDDDHRMGVDPYDNLRDQSLPVEPVGLDVSTDGLEIVTAHNIASNPAIGLSLNQWPASASQACLPHVTGTTVACPSFDYYLTGAVASGPTEVVHVPAPALARSSMFPAGSYQQGFLVTYDATPEIDLFRVNPDSQLPDTTGGVSPSRPFITRAAQSAITVNADGKDSRGIVIDPSARQACEGACAAGDVACLRACVDVPLQLFIANRLPPSLLLGQVQTFVVDSNVGAGTGSGIFDLVTVYDQTPLALGPSKVALGTAIDPNGVARRYVFAVTFDSRKIFMYDPAVQRVVQVIETGRGPHPIAFDACTTDCGPNEKPHAYLYVGHFTDSYLGVVDLDMRHPETFGTMFASIGAPLAPLESK